MPRTPREFEQMREESRARILDAALSLFAQRGYAATSVRRIAEEAGVAQGLLYNYFDGKEALLRAIFERGLGQVEADLSTAARASDPAQALEQLIRAAFATLRAHTDFWRLSYGLRMQPEVLAGLGTEIAGWSSAIVTRIEALLGGSAASGAASDVQARARVVFAAIDGAAQHYVLDPDGYPLDRTLDQMIQLFAPLAGAGASPSEPRG